MLTGNNKIVLNAATMNRAVQYWLNENLLQDTVEVVSIIKDSTTGNFEVNVIEPKKDAAK